MSLALAVILLVSVAFIAVIFAAGYNDKPHSGNK